MVKTTDVFVIGGGPAGLATAIAARQRGFDVVVADGAEPPIDKPCGEGLMSDGRAALEHLGIRIPAELAYPFRGIRFVSSGLSVDASFPNGAGQGVRRTVLHSIMVARAETAGISLLWHTPVTGLHPDGVLLGKHLVRSRWVVGADGGHSRVRHWAGLDHYRSDRTRFAFRRHYHISPWSDCMELHWGPRCQIYVTPVAADQVCFVLVSRDPHLRLDAGLRAFPELVSRLRGAEPSSGERGAISCNPQIEARLPGSCCLGRRCLRYCRCDYRRGLVPLVPPSGSARCLLRGRHLGTLPAGPQGAGAATGVDGAAHAYSRLENFIPAAGNARFRLRPAAV